MAPPHNFYAHFKQFLTFLVGIWCYGCKTGSLFLHLSDVNVSYKTLYYSPNTESESVLIVSRKKHYALQKNTAWKFFDEQTFLSRSWQSMSSKWHKIRSSSTSKGLFHTLQLYKNKDIRIFSRWTICNITLKRLQK